MSLDSVKQISPTVFSDSYAEARQKFMMAVPGSRAYRCGTMGPSGETLFTDAAYFGDPQAKQLLVLISGTHGPEGYCGSAAQLLFLQARFHEGLPPTTGVLFVHALNCYGFAWDRRVTAEGCDLNRNFVDFSKRLPLNPGYDELHEHFIPADISEEGLSRAEAVIAKFRSLHGELKLRVVQSSGQYTKPGGLHYGGDKPTEARRTLERIAMDFEVAKRDRVLIIDYHTGLGPYGYGELQCEHASGLSGYERAVAMFGPSVTSPDLGTSSGVAIFGSQADFWQRSLEDRHIYVCLEFGTYDPERARQMGVWRDDLWLFVHRPEEANSEFGRKIRNASKEYFYPQRSDWKEMILSRSHLVHRQAVEALT